LPYIFRVQQKDLPQQVERIYYGLQLLFLNCLTLNMNGTWFFKTWWVTHTLMQCHIPEEWNLQQHCC